jgi:putrescine transport system substrate-binding protein
VAARIIGCGAGFFNPCKACHAAKLRVVLTRFIITAVLAAAALAASGAEEKRLFIYNWADYIGRNTIPEFEKRTGIKVVYDLYDAEETMEARLMAGSSGYDIVIASTNFFGREIRAGVYQPLDKSQLTHWSNLDPAALALEAAYDPGNRYAMPYMHAINGFAYNVDKIRERMPDAPVDSLDMIFKPEVISKFADCGVSFLDSPEDVIQLAMLYLKLDPNTTRSEDFKAAEQLLLKVRPYVRAFDSAEYMNGLANQEVCIAMSWSSDYANARARAKAVGVDVHLAFTVPKEGANLTFTSMLIPVGAPHPHAAHLFLNYILEPQVIAEISNYTYYGNDNLASKPFVNPQILADPTLYPTPQGESMLYQTVEVDPAAARLMTRSWTRIKTAK